ncbi:O-antigen ligase family protein [Rhizobium sp. YIM 134829]|uniref:O-antigen ligase family protein n=1 Tax=Rhizobium sp. YIM 134829 TaxID=3390453 RepID=UPI00397AFC1A
MKFVVLTMVLVTILPIVLLARRHDPIFRVLWFCLGCFPFLLSAIPFFDIGILSWGDQWIGFVHGVEVSAVDFVAILCFLSLKRPRLVAWHLIPLCLWIVMAAVSMVHAPQPMAAFFGVWQLMRVLLVTAVVASAAEDARVPFLILKGMALGLILNAIASIWQHFGLGLAQSPGLFLHQNTLGMITHFVLFPHLALLLATRRENLYVSATVFACLLVVVLTASRATVGIALVGVALTYVIVFLSGATQRLIAIALAGTLCAGLLAPLAISAFNSRFDKSPLSEDVYDERAAFNRTALFIFHDHPFGVGINHYVSFAKNGGYAQRGGVADNESNRSNIVHNAYWLSAAETGFLGLGAFALTLASGILVALWAAFSIPNSTYRALLLGLAVATTMAAFHSTLEWIIYIKDVQYAVGLTIGLVSLISVQSAQRFRRQNIVPPHKFTILNHFVPRAR